MLKISFNCIILCTHRRSFYVYLHKCTTNNQTMFLSGKKSERVSFTLITSLIITTFSMTGVVFVDKSMSRTVRNNIFYLKLTMFRLLLCWIFINCHSNINKNIPRRPEVHTISAQKSRLFDYTLWRVWPNKNVKKRG